MACPNCDATMQSFGRLSSGDILFWCPRCGTTRRRTYVVSFTEPNETDETPMLVVRSRQVAVLLKDAPNVASIDEAAHVAGFYEACMTPEQRDAISR